MEIIKKVENFPETVIATFSTKIFNLFINLENVEKISSLSCVFAVRKSSYTLIFYE